MTIPFVIALEKQTIIKVTNLESEKPLVTYGNERIKTLGSSGATCHLILAAAQVKSGG